MDRGREKGAEKGKDVTEDRPKLKRGEKWAIKATQLSHHNGWWTWNGERLQPSEQDPERAPYYDHEDIFWYVEVGLEGWFLKRSLKRSNNYLFALQQLWIEGYFDE